MSRNLLDFKTTGIRGRALISFSLNSSTSFSSASIFASKRFEFSTSFGNRLCAFVAWSFLYDFGLRNHFMKLEGIGSLRMRLLMWWSICSIVLCASETASNVFSDARCLEALQYQQLNRERACTPACWRDARCVSAWVYVRHWSWTERADLSWSRILRLCVLRDLWVLTSMLASLN